MEASLKIDDVFQVQFVWRLPDDDYARAVFVAQILEIQPWEGRYLVVLREMVGGLQEASDGSVREPQAMAREYWATIVGFVGKKVQLAYESAEKNRTLYLRLTTLTGENKFFTRFDEDPLDAPK